MKPGNQLFVIRDACEFVVVEMGDGFSVRRSLQDFVAWMIFEYTLFTCFRINAISSNFKTPNML